MGPLYGREGDAARVRDVLTSVARDGAGRAFVIEGEAGIGKSSLLREACSVAERLGLSVLSARGAELERDFGFAIVRQLFERRFRALTDPERVRIVSGAARIGAAALDIGHEPAVPSRDQLATYHGLYWLVANLADEGPLVLAIDDVHWADAASVGWLVYLLPRLEDLGVAVVFAVRSGERSADPMLDVLLRSDRLESVVLAPLGADDVARIVRERFATAGDVFVGACHEATGGNPFLVMELVEALAAEPDPTDPGVVRRLGPQSIARHVLQRAASAGRPAISFAQAAAVLSPDIKLQHAAALAELAIDVARDAADALVDRHVLDLDDALSFVHPLVRTAVYEDIPQVARASMHARAARLLSATSSSTERVAMHLLKAERTGDAWVARTLLEAGSKALEAGAPTEAVKLLKRADDEPPPAELLYPVAFALGGAHAAVGELEAAGERLSEAAATAPTPDDRLNAMVVASTALTLSGRPDEAASALDAALVDVSGASEAAELRALLELAILTRGYQPLSAKGAAVVAELASRDIDENLVEGRLALGALAFDRVFRNEPAATAEDLALRAISGPPVPAELDYHLYPAVAALTHVDRLTEVEAVLHRLTSGARERGSLPATIISDSWSSYVAMRRGDLASAEAIAWRARELAREVGMAFGRFFPSLVLATVAIERGDMDDAVSATDEAATHGMGGAGWAERVGVLRGQVALAAGDARGALDILLEVGTSLDGSDLSSPAIVPWRSVAAEAALVCGRRDDAAALATEEVELARAFGAPRSLAIALRALGSVLETEAAIDVLREAVGVASVSPDRLEHARTRATLGSALRRAGLRTEARDHLAQAAELAARCGATLLEGRAREELAVAGARAGRRPVTGPTSLTPSERRVVDLAAAGHSNPEIAQALFLSRRTIESHLASAYRKLGIASREELAGALNEVP